MPIHCVGVEGSLLVKKAAFFGTKEFVLANNDSATKRQLPFPSDYKYISCFLPKKIEKLADRIENFKIRLDDIWILTFPKAGTTWITNIVWQLKNNMNFSADYLNAAYNYLEGCVLNDIKEENFSRFDSIDNEASPRIIKSHLPAHLLPTDIWTVKPKMIYMYRNAKDVAVSMYHMFRNCKNLDFQGSMEDWFDIFINDHVVYAPFSAHVSGFQKLNQLDHILLLSYDKMIAEPFSGVKQISEFLECKYTDDQLQRLTQHVSFENMRNSFQHDGFFRNDFK